MISQRTPVKSYNSAIPENNLSVYPLHMSENYPKCHRRNVTKMCVDRCLTKIKKYGDCQWIFVSVNMSTSPWNYRLLQFRSWYIKIVSMFIDPSTFSYDRVIINLTIVNPTIPTDQNYQYGTGSTRFWCGKTIIYVQNEFQKWKYF